jgi:hypothetical protein
LFHYVFQKSLQGLSVSSMCVQIQNYFRFSLQISKVIDTNYYMVNPTNAHWARVVDYGQFSLCVIHKEGLCPSSAGINGLMMITW